MERSNISVTDTPTLPARAAPYPSDRGIHHLIEAQVRQTPDAVAIVCGDQALTYAQLNSKANALARHLVSLGVRPKSTVALLANRSPYTIIAVLAIIKAGASYVPIDLTTPPKRSAYFLTDSNVSHLLFDTCARPILSQIPAPAVHGVDIENPSIYQGDDQNLDLPFDNQDEVYCIYTSGSTGLPKGVRVHHKGLVNYVWWARKEYLRDGVRNFALYSSLSFDLTITSLFVPLISGLCTYVYPDSKDSISALRQVVQENHAHILKLTPSHLSLLEHWDMGESRIKVLILGGEDLKAEAATAIHKRLPGDVTIYNEYGPTETVVGCMIYKYDPAKDQRGSVPIGIPIDNVQVHLLDMHLRPVPRGAVGEIYIGGDGVALGYRNTSEITAQAFKPDPYRPGFRFYASGDLGSIDVNGQLRFLGRKDLQVKLRGHRVELGEIESALLAHPAIMECAVVATRPPDIKRYEAVQFCVNCGIASSVPHVVLSDERLCNYCVAFREHRDVLAGYFGNMDNLKAIVEEIKHKQHQAQYDCIVALSGGKDSTYALCQMADLRMRVLAFTLDNGYISEKAKENIARVVGRLNVDHRYLSTAHMDEIFADSLRRHSNVCNGCFKTIYTLAINLAEEIGAPYVVMGLSKGQLFETRISELFRAATFDNRVFEKNLIEARKIYHRVDDAVSRLLDTRNAKDPKVIERVHFIDFYRYCHVTQNEMYQYIEDRVGWNRPSDTGRSTNCLINDVGIYVHNRERRYHNYAFPYSWDVRMGHLGREQAMRELDDVKDIDVIRVAEIMKRIGYEVEEERETQLVGYYVSASEIPATALRGLISDRLPEYMIPNHFVHLDRLPLTPNGKVNTQALPRVSRRDSRNRYDAPNDPIEEKLADLWRDVLRVDRAGIEDNFFDIGGTSLTAVMLLYRIDEQFGRTIAIHEFIRFPTIIGLSRHLKAALS